MALTDSAVRALRPKSRRYMRGDGRGLYLEVLPSGVKSWIYRYRFAGKPAKISMGQYPAMALREARDRRDAMRSLVKEGKSPVAERRLARLALSTEPTVQEFGRRYYREVVQRRRKNPEYIQRYLQKEVYPVLGNRRLRDVSAQDVQTLAYRKRDHGFEAAAIQIRGVLKRMFDYAVELHLVTLNPAAMVNTEFIGSSRPRERVLSDKEIRQYLRTVYRSNIRRQFKLALHIILLTLVRKSELLNAQWKNVNFETGEWLIPEEDSKNRKPHIVYMSRQVSEMFRELQTLAGNSELVLPGRGTSKRPFAKNALNKALEGLTFQMDRLPDGRIVEMEPFTIHDLRRTGATLLTKRGFNGDVIEKALNHEMRGIRAVYIRAEFAEERRKMLQFWADHVDRLINDSNLLVGNFGGRN